ncbi:MAG: hypothetical protein Q4C58_07400 [Eubacteriales bacterium]|nr:hypothetical protein [Eubacteriales bacterium]
MEFFVADDGAIDYSLNGSIYRYRAGQTEIIEEREYSKYEMEPHLLTDRADYTATDNGIWGGTETVR